MREGLITLNGREAKPSAVVQVGDVVTVVIPAPKPLDLMPQDIPVGIVYEDAHLIVVDKPAGLTVHPAPGHPDGTLVNALLAITHDLPGIGGTQRPGIVHRLDKDTSGLIVVAKTDAAHWSLARQLKERTVSKTYAALSTGLAPNDDGSVDAPIGRNPGNRKKMAIVSNGRLRADALSRDGAFRRATREVHAGGGSPRNGADASDTRAYGAHRACAGGRLSLRQALCAGGETLPTRDAFGVRAASRRERARHVRGSAAG